MVMISSILVILSITLNVQRCSAIVNGTVVGVKDAKWVVALIYEKTKKIVCTAALIELNWAITAAQCVEKYGISDVLYVVAGINNMEMKKEARIAYVMNMHVHPCYVNKNAYDIALLELSRKLEGSAASTIQLSDKPWPAGEMYRRNCDSAGWGSNTFRHTIEVLRKTRITTGHGTKGCPCTMRYDQKRMVCSTKGGQGLCTGDFGGVLVCDGKAVAIAHKLLNKKCSDSVVDDCRDFDAISSYVYICPYLSWIKKFVPSVPNKPASCFSPGTVATRALLLWSAIGSLAQGWLY